jgi:hypothetical protein
MIEQNDYQPLEVEEGWLSDVGPVATLRQAFKVSATQLALVNHHGNPVERQFSDCVGYEFTFEHLCERLVFEIGLLSCSGWDVFVTPSTAPTEDPDVDTLCLRVLVKESVGERRGELAAA